MSQNVTLASLTCINLLSDQLQPITDKEQNKMRGINTYLGISRKK